MERRNNPAGEPCRDWKETLKDVMLLIALVLFGVLIGICLCKLCPPFWHWLNSGWMETPWIPKALLAVAGLCISVALCMEDER